MATAPTSILYERYDQAGRFYVVRKAAHEDFSYALVMMQTGRLFTVYGTPVWTSDKSRFLTVGCSLQPPRGALVIQAPAGDGLATEAEIALPCETESCSARWDYPVLDLGDLHAARGGQEGHGIRRDPRQRRRLEDGSDPGSTATVVRAHGGRGASSKLACPSRRASAAASS